MADSHFLLQQAEMVVQAEVEQALHRVVLEQQDKDLLEV
jgi:hypothetical protein